MFPEIKSEERHIQYLGRFCRRAFFVCVCVGGGSGAFYRHSIVTLTQHLQAPVTVNEEGAMKDLAGVKRMEGMS